MWTWVFVVSLVVCGLASAAYIDIYEGAFNKFINEYNKNYDKETYGKRFKIFRENLVYIEDFNAKNTQMQLGINDMTDLTHDEYLNLLQPSRQPLDTTSAGRVFDWPSLPVSVDWRNKSDVAAVSDMRPCNSPIYSVVGSVQSFCSIAAGTMTSYDPKQVVQCAPGGCNATEDEIFGYIGHNGLHNTWSNCNISTNDQGCCISDHICFGGVESTLAVSVALMGPTVVSIDASQPSFKSYKNGLYVEPACNTSNLNFNLLVIGYATTPQGDEYWIAQNNWGTTWGQAGYIYMPRNQNSCGIAGHQCHPLGVHACVRSRE